MFISLFWAVLVFIAVLVVQQMLNVGTVVRIEDDGNKKFSLNPGEGDIEKAVAFGLLVGAVNFFGRKNPENLLWVMPVLLLIMVGVYVYWTCRWKEDGSEFKELVALAVLFVILLPTLNLVASATAALVEHSGWNSVIKLIPVICFVISLGVCLFDFFLFRYEKKEGRKGHSLS